MFVTNLRYIEYSVGSYGKRKAAGLTLHFKAEGAATIYYVVFNVKNTWRRGPQKGKALPSNRFWITEKHKFHHFWHNICGLPTPLKGLSTFHDCMGKLKKLRFQANTLDGKKLDKDSLAPITEILTDKVPTNFRLKPDKSPINKPDSELALDDESWSDEEFSNTCNDKHDISKHVSADISNQYISYETTNISGIQTYKEWLDEYEKQCRKECDELF